MAGTGKWRDPGVPHKGWIKGRDYKLNGGSIPCGMCEERQVTHPYEMTHPNYPGTLSVGYTCAQNMEFGYVEAEKKRTAKRRKRFPLLKSWKETDYGQRIRMRGYSFEMLDMSFDDTEMWAYEVHQKPGKRDPYVLVHESAPTAFSTAQEAMLAAFDAVWHNK